MNIKISALYVPRIARNKRIYQGEQTAVTTLVNPGSTSGGSTGGSHPRQHALNSPADHSPAAAADYDKYLHANATTGEAEWAALVQLWQRIGTVLSPTTPGDTMEIIGAKFGDPTKDYTMFDALGTMSMVGGATVYKRASHSIAILDATRAATWVGGLQILTFDWANDEFYDFYMQTPSDIRAGTNVNINLYWVPLGSAGGAQRVKWSLEYMWSNIGVTGSASTTLTTTGILPNQNLVGFRQYKSALGSIAGASVGNILCGRLFRDANHASDDFAADAGGLMIEMVYEADKLGE